MRWIAFLVLAAGCATGDVLSEARYNVAECEAQRADAQRRGDWRSTEAIGRDCDDWRRRVAELEDQPNARARHRRRFGAALAGAGNAYSAAGDVPPPQPTYHCSTDYAGGTVCRPQ